MSLAEAALDAALSAGREAWPGLRVAPEAFTARVRAAVADDQDAAGSIGQLCAADLYLACGCEAGDAAAITGFEREFLPQVPAFVARVDPSPAFADEVAQEVRDGLLVARQGGRPGISGYLGRGELGAFLRVVAVRTALRLKRGRQRAGAPMSQRTQPLARHGDPELDFLKLRYRAAYEEAFHAALASLEPRERLYLKLHYVDGVSLDRMGELYGLHRATVARHLAASRRKLREVTQAELERRAGVPSAEFSSLLAVVRSNLMLSLRGLR
jgi:RNA polymerase sigma-70 factor (ECF subfamily)